jgi:DNA-binding XRE family transcriptional regulator
MAQQPTTRGLPVPYLRAWRIWCVLTQADLAELAGINKFTIARAEAGHRIDFANIHKLATALGITVQQLLREDPSQPRAE